MSTSIGRTENLGHTWGRERAADEGHPDTWATDAETTPAGILLHAINVDGERRRVFVSGVLVDGIAELTEREAAEERDEPEEPPEDGEAAAMISDLEERLAEEVSKVEALERARDGWEEVARAMWKAAGRPAPGDPDLIDWTADKAGKTIGYIVDELKRLRERPLDAIAIAVGLDPRSTEEVVLAAVRGLATRDRGFQVVHGAPWSIEEVTELVEKYRTMRGPGELPPSQWALVDALHYMLTREAGR